jgi:O-antigen/teichoic acid export membrane protein
VNAGQAHEPDAVSATLAEAPGERASGPSVHSYGQILRATSIVGGGKLLSFLIALLRSKALALLLGPAGVGVMGLLSEVMTTAASLFGLGLGSSGVRQIAASGDPNQLMAVRRALWRSNLLLGVVGLASLCALSTPISVLVFGTPAHSVDVAWMGVGVLASLIAASQTALLQGMRRLGDMVRAGLLGTLLGSSVGIAIIWVQGAQGVRWFVLSTPLFSVLASAWYAHRLPRPADTPTSARALFASARTMATLGVVLMSTSLAGGLSALAIRAILTRELGVAATGQYHAASTIATSYLGLVLGAMAADYFPRLAQVATDPRLLNQNVNDQLEVALLLSAPILLGMLALAPWILAALYSSAFQPAAELMRWQILGDVLRVPSWALGFIVLAHGQARLHLITELTTLVVLVVSVYALTPLMGLTAAGVAFGIQYLYYFPAVWWIARYRYGFEMRRAVLAYLASLLAAALLIFTASTFSGTAAAVLGVLLAVSSGLFALHTLVRKGDLLTASDLVGRALHPTSRLPPPR